MKELAAARNMALTEEALRACAHRASTLAGKRGATEAGHLWNAMCEALYQAVKTSYTEEFGSNNAHGVSDQLDASLGAAMEALDLKITPAFDELNFSAIREKLLHTGCYSLMMQPLYR